MQIDVVDRTGVEARGAECRLHGAACAMSLGVRRGHVVRVARFADAQQQNSVAVHAVRWAFEQSKGRGLTDRNPVACDVERAARQRRRQLQRVEAL